MTIRIVVVDDHELLRDALRSLLADDDELEVVGEAGSGHAAIELVRELVPDVVVMDLLMTGSSGIEATRQIVAENPNVKVLALSAQSGRRWVLGALDAGASGYVLKADSSKQLRSAVRAVARGETFVCPGAARVLVRSRADAKAAGEPQAIGVLTPRERDVLRLIAEGHSSRVIAGRLGRSPHTIDTHRRNLMRKLELTSVADLTRYAIREGLTSMER